ncbi:unnamed protein product [Ambrosiozyma monospora]|uniref:Unnamed protein product n=1 Tax=Ambrosiozyma monospora TaxID=43982 RepID=A0A9W6YW96_AMBMO|nr:unnamed protein product [Ambrosiozyma monospora]
MFRMLLNILLNGLDKSGRVTIIAVSRYFTSNPDLAERLKNGQELTKYDRTYFYAQTNYKYNTWGKFGEENKGEDSVEAKQEMVALA